MRRVPIRLKLAAALSIPLLALGVVTVLEVLKSADEVAQIRSQTDLAEAAIGPSGLVSALQNERTWPAVDLVGQTAVVDMPVEGYEDTRAATDAALIEFRDLIESKGASVREAYRDALEQLEAIDQLRADIDDNIATVNPRTIDNNFAFSHEVFSRYSELIQPFFDATTRISLAIDDPELRQGTELADTATRQIEEMSLLLNGVMGDAMSEGGIDTTAEIASSSVRLTRLENNAEILRNASGPYAAISAEHFPAALTDRVATNVREAVNTNSLDLAAVFADVNVPKAEGYIALQEAIAEEVNERRDSLNSTAEARQRWFIFLAVVVLGTAITLTWLVSRSITKPLRALTSEAKDMAERRLPEAVINILETPLGDDVVMPHVTPVRLQTRDEVADVSDALNTVQDSALDLAVEQAVLRRNIADSFVNLGRRNQNLLGRQLDFITELETNETDADTLANLFRLDHLATRMRRNAESLLVLAGIEPPRKWAAPVRLTDVIRAALGEVEDYQRVTVRGVEPATILGSTAADLAHLMAELIENALVFSPPDQSVDIRGRNRPDGYTLAIIDSGLGMPSDDIVAANRRLAGAESFTIAPSKYLGHYVAGNLAARHDIHVHLDNSPGNGVTATIDLPPTLLTTDTALAAPVTPPHGTRAIAAPEPLPALPTDSSWTEDTPDWLMPDTAAVGQGASVYPPPPPTEARRTESGLTKRNARPSPAAPIGAEGPSGDLLDALSRHNARLHGGAPSSYAPSAPAPTPERSPLPTRGWEAPSAPPPVGPAARTASRSWPLPTEPGRAPRSRPGPLPTPDRLPTPDPIPAPDPATLPGPPEPFTPTWTPSPAPDGWEPPHSSRARATAPEPGPAPAPPLPSRGQSDMAAGGDTTTGGLARRVRGAQLPTTEPVRMRRPDRAQAPASSGAATPAPRTAPARTPEQRRQADDVYNFLSNFTAGVRRGLDEASHEPQAGPDEPHPGDPRWR